MNESIYHENGYNSRTHYLECMAKEYDVDLDTVYSLAGVLGPDEDFDGLIVALDDYNELL